MKNKRAKESKAKESQHRITNPPITKLNIKNREKLRKKLKVLLENENSAHNKNPQKTPKNVTTSQNPNSHLNAFNKQEQSTPDKMGKNGKQSKATQQVESNKSVKIEKLQKKKKGLTKKITETNGKQTNNKKLKRKSSDEPLDSIGPIKGAKLSKSSKLFENNSKGKNSNKKSVQSNISSKNVAKTKKKTQLLPKNKTEEIKVQIKKKSNKNSKQSKVKTETNKESTKKIKKQKITKNPALKRGPLRPETSDSELYDSFSNNIPEMKKKVGKKSKKETKHAPIVKEVSNNEQALTRVGHDNFFNQYDNDEHDDNDYLSDDYDYNSSSEYDISEDISETLSEEESFTYGSMEDEWSTSDVEFYSESSCDDSASDHTYEPPENITEDVYIASGTAIKHDLSENNDPGFDSDTSSAQVIELPSASVIPNSYPGNSTEIEKIKRSIIKNEDSQEESDNSCPELVPIENSQYNYNESGSEYSSYSSSYSESDDGSYSSESSIEQTYMTPEIIKATKQKSELLDGFFEKTIDKHQNSNVTSSPLEIIKNSEGNISSFKVFTIHNEVVSPDSFNKPPTNISKEEIEIEIENVNENGINSNQERINKPTEHDKKTKESPKPKAKDVSKTLFYNAINSNHVIVLLKDPLYIYGTVKIKLFAGSLEIFGYNPKPFEVLEVFSPRGYSSLKIEPSSSGQSTPLNKKDLLSLSPFYIQKDLEDIIAKFEVNKDAIVILERNDRSKKVNMLKKYMIEHIFPNMNSIQSDRPFYTSEFLLRCILTTQSEMALNIDPIWKTISLNNRSRTIVIGGKSVGKSTLVRYLVNRTLNKNSKILLIDLDIGQPEMFVPQTVSATALNEPLLGPGYFFNKEPDKSILVGQMSIILVPQTYLEAVNALIKFCKENKEYEDIPWVVNTMGYNKGFGDEIIAAISTFIQPTNIIQLESDREINNFDVIMSKDNLQSLEWNIIGDMVKPSPEFKHQHTLTLLKSVIPNNKRCQKEWIMNPKDTRLAMILTRLSGILSGYAEWLADVKPVSASIDDLLLIHCGDDQVSKEDLLKALDGNLVYLCWQVLGEPIECLGIGIVRGVDYHLKQVYLLPAIPLEVLRRVNCLAICEIPLPSSILINQGPKVKGVAPYVYNTVKEASSLHVQQKNHRPQHFLTGKHSSLVE